MQPLFNTLLSFHALGFVHNNNNNNNNSKLCGRPPQYAPPLKVDL